MKQALNDLLITSYFHSKTNSCRMTLMISKMQEPMCHPFQMSLIVVKTPIYFRIADRRTVLQKTFKILMLQTLRAKNRIPTQITIGLTRLRGNLNNRRGMTMKMGLVNGKRLINTIKINLS